MINFIEKKIPYMTKSFKKNHKYSFRLTLNRPGVPLAKPSENHKFKNLDSFQSLKLRIIIEKNPSNFS